MLNSKKIHVVSFDVPYPPNYGGVIDVFYKLKTLHEQGVEIHLHTFNYGRGEQKELNKLCESVTYYKRRNSVFLVLSYIPFIILSRKNKNLLKNLNQLKIPVLFEGLHTSFPLGKIHAKTYIRTHNIEHSYYYGLGKSEKNIFKKIFFYTEAIKLYFFEKNIIKTDGIFSISKLEQDYFLNTYGEKSTYIPAFHEATFKNLKHTKEKFILWHGDLRTSDNIKSVSFLIEVYKNSNFKFKIASSVVPNSITNKLKKVTNIEFIKLKDNKKLDVLLSQAHINILYTNQNTGIKLKLLNALYKGKFVIGNKHLTENTGLEDICELANTKKEFLEKTNLLFQKEFTNDILEKRKEVLIAFNPTSSAKKMISIIFKH